MKKDMNIEETFLKLTSKTYPYGYESELTSFLPSGYETDRYGNFYYVVGDSETVFTSHFDTACKDQVKVTHVKEGNIIKTDGTSILGADDKAGVTIMLYMISKNVPGVYFFFIGEEVGCIGSGMASNDLKFFSNYKRMISFDRKGTTSIITHQSYTRCCSDGFADDLANEYMKHGMFMVKDDTGVYTDSAEFVSIIPECTNISVGYYKEHTKDEHQDIEFLKNIAEASAKVNWDGLVTKRDYRKREYKSFKSSYKSTYVPSTSTNDVINNYRKSTNRSTEYDDYYDGDPYELMYTKNNKKKYFKDNVDKQIKKALIETKDQSRQVFNDWGSKKVKHDTSYYEAIKGYYLNDKLSKEEFDIIKNQYLDYSDPQDLNFIKFMEKELS